jgi:hypothetical protein
VYPAASRQVTQKIAVLLKGRATRLRNKVCLGGVFKLLFENFLVPVLARQVSGCRRVKESLVCEARKLQDLTKRVKVRERERGGEGEEKERYWRKWRR